MRSGTSKGSFKRKGKRRGAHFMDAAMEGFVRDLALHKWREIEGLLGDPELELPQVLEMAGQFMVFGAYHGLWEKHWKSHLSDLGDISEGKLYEKVEQAIREALYEERELRIKAGGETVEDTRLYQEFVARAMGVLYEETEGEMEMMEDF